MAKSSKWNWKEISKVNTFSKKSSDKIDFRSAVTRKPESVWAYEIDQTIENRSLACWVASVIWWSFGHKARSDGKLFEMMNDYKLTGLTDNDFQSALKLLNLPTI